jgi:hypothetical protein
MPQPRPVPGDVLVASATPGVCEALRVGNDLYAAEIAVTTAREVCATARTRAGLERADRQLAAAEVRRDALDLRYVSALAAVKAADPAAVDPVEDAVWRAYLVGVRSLAERAAEYGLSF